MKTMEATKAAAELTEQQLETLAIKTTSAEAFAINQEIVKALTDALASYKKERLDVSFKNHIKLDPERFSIWMRQDNRFGKSYEISIEVRGGRFYREATFTQDRETSDVYATRYRDSITIKSPFSETAKDWREGLIFSINRFNDCDGYEWDRNLRDIFPELLKLNREAEALRERAEALVKTCPAPVNDPLGRTNHKPRPYYFEQLFPALWGKK